MRAESVAALGDLHAATRIVQMARGETDGTCCCRLLEAHHRAGARIIASGDATEAGTAMTVAAPLQPTAIHAMAAELRDCGFRLLMIRQFDAGAVPPAFAIIDQHLMRMPERRGHGVLFAATFLPDVMAWLIDHLGPPSLHDASGRTHRNPRWPVVRWHDEELTWPSGAVTAEWFAEVAFQDHASWLAFRSRWQERLKGIETGACAGEADRRTQLGSEKEFVGDLRPQA